jgi:hypothetical protein
MAAKRKSYLLALTLFFLAPTIGELLSGSAPPAEFFNPISLLVLAALYGSGAILIRELRVRWNKGWPTVFALGAAYGILEEGLMVKSFFDPDWMDLDILGVYGRWGGVNWVWSFELTLYHAVFSIAIPILLVELLFPDQRNERWLGRRGMISLSLLLLADVLLGFFLLTPYRPPLVPYLLAIVSVLALYWIAQRLPAQMSPIEGLETSALPRPRRFVVFGFGATLAFFFINWVWPHLNVPVLLTLLGTVALAIFNARRVWKMSCNGTWGDEHRLALASGALGFFMLLAPLQELDASRTDNTTGMTLVGLVALSLLIWLGRRVRRQAGRALIEATI